MISQRRKRRGYIVGSNDRNLNANMPGFINDDFDDNVAEFIKHTRAAGRSPDTIRYYSQNLRKFKKALEENGVSTRLTRITTDNIIEHFIEYYTEVKKNKYTTVTTVLRAVRAFFNWAKNRGIIEKSPMEGIKVSNRKTTAIQTFSREDLREIFRQPDLETFVGLRDYTIMTLFLETGIRLRELVDLKVSDIRWPDSQIAVLGKNGHVRLVPFQAKTRHVLKRYLAARGDSPVDWLFITQDDEKMSRKAVQERIAKYGRMANIKHVRCSPHTFRHTFAKMSIKNGADVFSLQKILGHSTLEMVRVYVHMFSDEVAEAHKRFSPIENLF